MSAIDKPVHCMEVRTAFHGGEVKSRAHCSCGWSSDVLTTEDAKAQGIAHRTAAAASCERNRPRRISTAPVPAEPPPAKKTRKRT